MTRRVLLATLVATLLFGCQTSPQRVPLAIRDVGDPPDAHQIADYTTAVDAIIRVFVQKYELPVPRYTLEIYTKRDDFEAALVKYLRLDPVLAQSTARFAKSAVGGGRVLVNEPAVAGSTWPKRIELLSHELTHTVELELANHRSLTRNQWLIEGFAEWMAFNVTDALGLDNMAGARLRMTAELREVERRGGLPRLVQVDSLAQWVAARNNNGFEATYALSFLTVNYLIERHSLQAVVDYFHRFRASQDHVANFRAAFGESLEDFEDAVERHLAHLLG